MHGQKALVLLHSPFCPWFAHSASQRRATKRDLYGAGGMRIRIELVEDGPDAFGSCAAWIYSRWQLTFFCFRFAHRRRLVVHERSIRHPSFEVSTLKLEVEGQVATLTTAVALEGGLSGDYKLKPNGYSYDLSVDIELADVVQRLRFEHPEVGVVIVQSGLERVFCAGANIAMLAQSSHTWKVNFFRYTNETRLAIENASRNRGQKYVAAILGAAPGATSSHLRAMKLS
jgi:hypothetical protein